MQINDRFLTVATGILLAIGGATASLFLGEEEAEPIVIASVAAPEFSTLSDTTTVLSDASDLNDAIAAGTNSVVVLAAVDPAERSAPIPVALDLNAFDTLAVAPELAMPQDFKDIVITSAPALVETHDLPRFAASLPDMAFDISDLVKIKPVAALSCSLDIRATPIFGARVTLKVSAPCHPNVAVTIKHGGLQFKERLDDDGTIELKIPAFAEYARFDVELADGLTSTVGAYISGLSALERVGVAWNGANDTFLHALENGAEMGEKGHVWRATPNSYAASRMNGGGYMTTLGDPSIEGAQLLQVYTLPKQPRKKAQIVDLQIETLRGAHACGQDIDLRVAQHRVNSGAAKSELSLTLPACGSDDTSLVLKNALKDMKVARK
jgi:hypothetical protein